MSLKKICLWTTLITVVVALVAIPVLAQGKAAGKKEAAKAEKGQAAEKGKAKAEGQTPPKPGMVWANTQSKVYHKEGGRYYGKTKNGQWMTEEDAIKAGYKEAGQGAAKKGEGAKKEGAKGGKKGAKAQ